jgi:hypothetical protein
VCPVIRSGETSPLALVRSVSLGLVLAAGGCAMEAPVNPSFEEHVRPILEARCLRCHSNPTSKDLTTGLPPDETPTPFYSYDFHTEAELHLPENETAVEKLVLAYTYLRGFASPAMPLAPAAPLEEWQIETLERWGKAFQP